MTPLEYKSARKKMGITQKELGKLIGVDGNTISRRELGLVPITREAELALLSLSDHSRHKSEGLKLWQTGYR